jgi:hypothetical protein
VCALLASLALAAACTTKPLVDPRPLAAHGTPPSPKPNRSDPVDRAISIRETSATYMSIEIATAPDA